MSKEFHASEVVRQGTISPMPIPDAIITVSREFHDGVLYDAGESSMGMKALLFVLGISEIPTHHDELLKAMRVGMRKVVVTEDDEVFILYELFVLNLHTQKQAAAKLAAEKATEAARMFEEVERLKKWHTDLIHLKDQLREVGEKHSDQMMAIEGQKHKLSQDVESLKKLEELLKRREQSLRKRQKKFRREKGLRK